MTTDIIDQTAQEDIKTVLRALKKTGHLCHGVYNSMVQNATPRFTDIETALRAIFPLAEIEANGADPLDVTDVLETLILQVARER